MVDMAVMGLLFYLWVLIFVNGYALRLAFVT